MKAKLVTVNFTTRVIVEDNATEEEILVAAKLKVVDKVINELGENLEDILDDTVCPYDPETDIID